MIDALRMDEKTAKEIIEGEGWATCWICEKVFRRRLETKRYCAKCDRGFCDGQHGSFAYGRGTCVVCGTHKSDRP